MRDYEGMQDFLTAIGRGEVEWAEPFASYGKYISTGAVTNHVVWPDGTYNIPPSNGVQLSIVSTSANDDGSPVGTGARTIEIDYLDADLIPRFETITMNGTTPVLTVATNIRFVQSIHILAAGTLHSSYGTISASNGGTVYAQLESNGRRSASSARMVPKGKKLFIAGSVGGASSGTAAARVEIKISASYFEGHDYTGTGIFIPFGAISMQDNSISYTFPIPIGAFPEGTIVLMETTTDKAATVTGNWFGWLENA